MNQTERMAALENRMQRMADDFESLKLLVEKNNTNLEEFIDLGKALKFGLKIAGGVEKLAVWITKITLAGGTIWAGWKFLVKEAIASITKHS